MSKIVVFTDICSSSVIVEGLSEVGRIRRWRTHLNALLDKLEERKDELHFDIYKFLGDGWLLLFEANHNNKLEIINFFKELCELHVRRYNQNIRDFVGGANNNIGLSFGLYIGDVYPVTINDQAEFIGESLNIASRFQSSIKNPKDSNDNAVNQILMSYPDYAGSFKKHIKDVYGESTSTVERTLRNIKNNRTWVCARIYLINQ